MTINDWLVIVAIVLAPLLALQVQKKLERRREDKARKLNLFKTLMTTRGSPLNPQHVQALNLIDVEFYKNKKIVETWKMMLDNYNNFPKDPIAANYQAKLDACVEKANDLLSDLLLEIGRTLGYSFDKVHLKRAVYSPKGHADLATDQEIIRKNLVSILSGTQAIPIKIINPNNQEKEQPKS
jgi:hypothetical protein